MQSPLTAFCPAKINLALRVLGKRADGYHELDSLIARIRLCDELRVEPRDDERLTITCDSPDVPLDERNLVLRAARALIGGLPRQPGGVAFHLRKRIPSGAGLGGGSSDAAAALGLLNALWGLNLPRERLAEIGAAVGSDVPLFFYSPLCRIRGRGERVEDVAAGVAGWVTLFLPNLHSSTPAVYGALKLNPSSAEDIEAAAALVSSAQSCDVALARLQGPLSISALPRPFVNDLMSAAFAVTPGLEALYDGLRRRVGPGLAMSGSGCAMFHVCASRDEAADLATRAGDIPGLRTEVVAFEFVREI